MEDERIDPHRVYLVGYSMGGHAAWALAARAPERFAAVVPIAGGGDPKFAEQLVDVPLWAVHGADDEVVPVMQSREMSAAVKEVGGNPRLSEPLGVGHAAWRVVFRQDSDVLDWMFRQRLRTLAPPEVTTPGSQINRFEGSGR